MQEGKLLGHIVSKEGVNIDPQRVEAIKVIILPRNKKEIQSFLGKINFLRRFIPNFVEVVKDLTDMLKRIVKLNGLQRPDIHLIKLRNPWEKHQC
jgi:hypothetical protein